MNMIKEEFQYQKEVKLEDIIEVAVRKEVLRMNVEMEDKENYNEIINKLKEKNKAILIVKLRKEEDKSNENKKSELKNKIGVAKLEIRKQK